VLLSNFRVSHGLRAQAKHIVYPLLSRIFTIDERTDAFMPPQDPQALFEWEKTGRRHNPAYYEHLKASQAVACFGGFAALARSRIRQPQRLAAIIDRLFPARMKAIYQWDSFRLWEAWAAGCLVLHVDLAAYGLHLPVMPENLVHYTGVDFTHPQRLSEVLEDQPELLAQIATQGQAWSLEHYSPRQTARRFLSLMGLPAGSETDAGSSDQAP
jgi:hypothetical protein